MPTKRSRLSQPVRALLVALAVAIGITAGVVAPLEFEARQNGFLEVTFSDADAALDLGTLEPSFDGTRSTPYPAGDKPQGSGTCPPSGWTVASKGSGAGEICDTSGTWTFSVSGNSAANSNRYVYKTPGAGDFQLTARVASYSGATANYAGVGVGISDGSGDSATIIHSFVTNSGTTVGRCIAGVPGSTTGTNGASGQVRPYYVGITYDDSENDARCWESADGSTWSQIAQLTHDFASARAIVTGNSGANDVTLTASVTNVTYGTSITLYTPSAPPPSAPTLATPIPSQSGQVGQAFSLALADYFTGATSYSASGLPTGISVNTSSGVISGTPSGAGTSSVTASATNAGGTTPTNFSLVVSPASVSGDTFTIPAANTKANWNCNISADWTGLGGTGVPVGGDTVVWGAGNHIERHFQNCEGNSAVDLTFQNDTGGAGPAIFRRTSTTFGGFSLRFSNTHYVHINGLGKWAGAPSGTCGINPTTLAESTTSGTDYAGTGECGIVVTKTSTGTPNTHLKFSGFASNIIVEGVEIHGRRTGPGEGGIGIEVKDEAAAYSRANNPGEFYENLIFRRNYIRDTNASGTYIGANWHQGNLPLRNIEQAYMLVTGSGGRCLTTKSSTEGDNSIHDSRCYTSGLDGPNFTQGFGHGIQVSDGYADVYRNILTNCGENCIAIFINDVPRTMFDSPIDVLVENNIVHNAGARGPGNGVGIRFDDTSTASERIPFNATARFNTVDTTTHQGILIDVGGSKSASNNIVSNASGTAISGVTGSNNRTGATGDMGYVASGSDNFHITSGSAARNAATGTCPDTDVDGDARPNGSACDQGADEYVP